MSQAVAVVIEKIVAVLLEQRGPVVLRGTALGWLYGGFVRSLAILLQETQLNLLAMKKDTRDITSPKFSYN